MSLFTGKVAIVTGAGSPRGIGRGVALALARQGVRLVVIDIVEDKFTKGCGRTSRSISDTRRSSRCR